MAGFEVTLYDRFWGDPRGGAGTHPQILLTNRISNGSRRPGTDFNFDYNASFTPAEVAKKEALYNFEMQKPPGSASAGVSVFLKDKNGELFHTYSAFARGIDLVNTTYNYLDLTRKGGDEEGHERPQFWVRRHDEYDN